MDRHSIYRPEKLKQINCGINPVMSKSEYMSIERALYQLQSMLSIDGYTLEIAEYTGDELTLEIKAGQDACADCLVPKSMMVRYVDAAIAQAPELGAIRTNLIYPSDRAATG
jgi:hypothetical protein